MVDGPLDYSGARLAVLGWARLFVSPVGRAGFFLFLPQRRRPLVVFPSDFRSVLSRVRSNYIYLSIYIYQMLFLLLLLLLVHTTSRIGFPRLTSQAPETPTNRYNYNNNTTDK